VTQQPAEETLAAAVADIVTRRWGANRWRFLIERWRAIAEALMWATVVVIAHVRGDDVFEMATTRPR
jgi:hypothetical protein